MSGAGGWMWMPEDPPTLMRLLTPQLDGTSVLVVGQVIALCAYMAGIRQLRRRGVVWPWHRTAAFCAGILALWLVTGTQVMGYSMMLFSIHMFQHMVLTILSPMLIMLGAPLRLAMRTLPRQGRRVLPRRILLRGLRSPTMKVVCHPVTTTVLFLISLYGVYLTPILDDLMASLAGNLVMITFFFVSGLLAFGGAFALDPWPRSTSAPIRLLDIALPGPAEAFFAVVLMMASRPLIRTFTNPPQDWGIDVMTDQLAAGNIVWGFGEFPTFIAVAIVFFQWVKSEERGTIRSDRIADDELALYNAHLARMAATSRPGPPADTLRQTTEESSQAPPTQPTRSRTGPAERPRSPAT